MTASVLSPQTWPFSLEWLPPSAYLVGGNVRDALLGRYAEYLDLDFVLPQGAVATARSIAHHYQAGYVLLDAARQIARVVFDHATVDFAQQVGDSLEEDLQRRDFTVNAIAYSPHSQELFDPLQGYQDLQRRLIRMVAPENLKEDPLRLLRAYRQAAQLGFSLEQETQETIYQFASLLKFIAAERVQGELNYLFRNPQGTPMLTAAWQAGLLDYWLPHANGAALALVAKIDQVAIDLDQNLATSGLVLSGWGTDPKTMNPQRNWVKIAKLACLVGTDLEIAEGELWRLKYSRAEVQAVLAVLKTLPQFPPTSLVQLSSRQQYYFFREIGTALPVFAMVAVAMGTPIDGIAPYIQRFLTPDDRIAHPMPILSGRDLMNHLQLSPSPRIGEILEAMQLAQAEGKIHSVEAAIAFAKAFAQSSR